MPDDDHVVEKLTLAESREADDRNGGLTVMACVESLLFVADATVTVARLAEALEVEQEDVERALVELEQSYVGRGLCLQRGGNRVQLTTVPQSARHVERFLGLESRVRLSRAALETLAIVSYRQPITRPEIESIRGVNSDSVIRTLLSGGMIEAGGRSLTVGRPILYGTTFEFLQQFGLRCLEELPPLEQIVVAGDDEL